MDGDGEASAFVTGASGFIGTELVKLLVGRGHRVFGLARSLEAARRIRRAGATAVMGDLLEPGPWQDEAAADWVFHLPPHPLGGRRMSWRRARAIVRARLSMDTQLLDAVFSNIRLRGSGFRFQYSTLEQGLQQVVGALHE